MGLEEKLGDVPDPVTLDWLEDHGACEEHCWRFAEAFPDGMRITATNLRQAAKAGLSLSWGSRYLADETRFEFTPECFRRRGKWLMQQPDDVESDVIESTYRRIDAEILIELLDLEPKGTALCDSDTSSRSAS